LKNKVLIIGVGNVMYGDDAFGVLFTEALKQCTNKELDVLSAGKNLFYIASMLNMYNKVIFVDILGNDFGKEGQVVVLKINPGVLSEEEIALLFSRETFPHTPTPAHVVALAYASKSFSGEGWIVGVVSENRNFVSKISDNVINAVPEVCQNISEILSPHLNSPLDCRCVSEVFEKVLEQHYRELGL